MLISKEDTSLPEFRYYFRLTQGAGIWIENLDAYLNPKEITKISKLAVEFLNSENDLLNSENEFTKIWLDAQSYLHKDIKTEIPTVEFNYENIFDFIESVNYHKWRYRDLFSYQKTRSFCYSLLRIIVHNEPERPEPYQNILRLLKDTTRPFLSWTLYRDIPRHYPFVIPYILTDTELIPIAFKLIDNIGIDDVFLSEQDNNDRTEKESCELKNQLWIELFDFVIEQFSLIVSNDEEKGQAIVKILIDLAKETFTYNANNKNSIIAHNALRTRYDKALKKLSSQRIEQSKNYPRPLVNPRIITFLLPYLSHYMENKILSTYPNHTEFLQLKSAFIDLSIEILRLSNIGFAEDEIPDKQKLKISEAITSLTLSLGKYLSDFYSQTDIDVQSYTTLGIERKKAKRGINEFGTEIIDWGYLFLNFEKTNSFDRLYNGFVASLKFNIDENKYEAQNKEQFEKIKLFLKTLFFGFISINQRKDLYEIEGFPVKSTLAQLEKWIRELSLLYSIDDLPQKRIDAFNESLGLFGYNPYYQPLTSLLYNSINYFTEENPDEFVRTFFAASNDIGRMLTAINILDSKEQRAIISQRISEVKIEDFIDNSFTTTELQNALVEAVNSENHWELAKPLIERIQKHFSKKKHHDENRDNLLFQVNLLLAFKEKDFSKLVEVNIPQKPYVYPAEDKKMEQMRQFYIALFKLYNESDYDEAIKIFKSLLSKDAKNVRYAFHLYRAETLKAIMKIMDIELLNQANLNWENFISGLTDEEKKELSEIAEPIFLNRVHYYATIKDSVKFDQAINTLSKRYLYDEEIVPTIYKCYIERDLHELAYDFIQKAKDYLTNNGIAVYPSIQDILNNAESVQLLQKYKISLERIRNLTPSKIPSITPETINEKRDLNTFILNELIQSLKIIRDKKEALRQVTHENRYNDFLQAILRFRFPIWGWSIHDQPRVGTSVGGKDAGNADLVIQSGGGYNIALIEAFILRDKNYTETHILKCPNYLNTINRYYVVVYYLDDPNNFENKWTEYKSDVLSLSYPADFGVDSTAGFIDMKHEFEDIVNIKIAKTIHNTNLEMFHVMINLG